MKGNRPKRRKDKYNPYTIYEKNGHYYISFKDGQSIFHKFEISKVLYDAFDSFELGDLVYLNVVDRHIWMNFWKEHQRLVFRRETRDGKF